MNENQGDAVLQSSARITAVPAGGVSKMIKLLVSLPVVFLVIGTGCATKQDSNSGENSFDVDREISYCLEKTDTTLNSLHSYNISPRQVHKGEYHWSTRKATGWTSGFWPGILWYCYEYTNDNRLLNEAVKFTRALEPILEQPVKSHDLGFIFNNSFGHAYRITGDSVFREILVTAADSLTHLYNEHVGTVLSWPAKVREKKFYPHNTIIDNMMNLELLFRATEITGDSSYFHIANRHALTTLKNHIRPDATTWHVLVYDDQTGEVLEKRTHQGYSDSSTWARGQAWGIYGFTMCYRETGDTAFLHTASALTDAYLERLPEEMIPRWDFDVPGPQNAPKDASAAAITASAMIELSGYIKDASLQDAYRHAVIKMLKNLSSDQYKSNAKNAAFILHATGSKPGGYEVDVPLIYADYYYLEALVRLRKSDWYQP